MNELVSVIMPAYQCEQTIEESVRSVLSQTYEFWELIIVDDCSTDNTPLIITGLSSLDTRIKVLTLKSNEGVASARNHGIEASKGKWIAFLDSDDMWLPDKLEKQILWARKTGAVLLYTGAECVNIHSQRTGRIFQVPETVTYRSLLCHNDLICSAVLVRKDLYLTHPMERSDLHEDYICWLSLLTDGAVAYGVQESLTLYRISSKSKSGNKFKSAAMMWRTYRYIGLNPVISAWYFIHYAAHGVFRHWL